MIVRSKKLVRAVRSIVTGVIKSSVLRSEESKETMIAPRRFQRR